MEYFSKVTLSERFATRIQTRKTYGEGDCPTVSSHLILSSVPTKHRVSYDTLESRMCRLRESSPALLPSPRSYIGGVGRCFPRNRVSRLKIWCPADQTAKVASKSRNCLPRTQHHTDASSPLFQTIRLHSTSKEPENGLEQLLVPSPIYFFMLPPNENVLQNGDQTVSEFLFQIVLA